MKMFSIFEENNDFYCKKISNETYFFPDGQILQSQFFKKQAKKVVLYVIKKILSFWSSITLKNLTFS